ncbi:MAG: ATP-binding protein, partial [Thermoplasmatota archaeon]
ITPGALPRANGGVITIDELDKFSSRDRKGLLTAMEEGIITIEKGGMSARFDARCRVIACCNTSEHFSKELIDRFDFHFKLDKPSKEQQQKIISKIVDGWFREKDGYSGTRLRYYLDWIKPYIPDLPDDVRKFADKLLRSYINLEDDSSGIRKKQSVLRVATTLAKLERRAIRKTDIMRSLILVDPEMEDTFKNEIENGFINSELQEVVEKVIKD